MQTAGNLHAEDVYGAEKVDPCASKEKKQHFVMEKYEQLSFAGKSSSVRARPEKVIRPAVAKQERSPTVLEAAPSAVNSKMVAMRPVQYVPETRAKATPIARETTIPDNLFDELFNEVQDTYLSSSVPAKTNILEPTDGGLDAFLNTTLAVKSEEKVESHTSYLIGSDPSQKVQHSSALSDVFADWPEF
jgi:hypothetical protein